jgi:hypothetical protein
MHAVILSFPGHFYQTHLTVRSLIANYPEVRHLTFVLDDVHLGSWSQYVSDFDKSIRQIGSMSFDINLMSSMPSISSCEAGWWRQQLIKLTLDLILPDPGWFVVDGDVLFDARCDVSNHVPISRRGDNSAAWDLMCVNYVKNLLGIGPGAILDQDERVGTSPIPFRYLSRDVLQGLRRHVEYRFGKDFLQAHLDWFADQTIVAHWDPADRWVMSEWELIECYRRYVLKQFLPLLDLGPGYSLDTDIQSLSYKNRLFRHAYRRDTEMPLQIFPNNGQDVDNIIWHKAKIWYDEIERPQRQ